MNKTVDDIQLVLDEIREVSGITVAARVLVKGRKKRKNLEVSGIPASRLSARSVARGCLIDLTKFVLIRFQYMLVSSCSFDRS